jgi:hypothetical protein
MTDDLLTMYGFYAFTGGREYFIFFFIQTRQIISFAIKKWSYLSHTTFKKNCRLALQKCWKIASDFPFSLCMNKHVGIILSVSLIVLYTGARGTDHPPFSNFLFTNLFSIKFLYFFIISSLFPYTSKMLKNRLRFSIFFKNKMKNCSLSSKNL